MIPSLIAYRKHVYQAHINYALDQCLEPLFSNIPLKDLARNLDQRSMADRCIVFVDNRPQTPLRFSILNTLLMTAFKVKCIVFTTSGSQAAMEVMLGDLTPFVDIVNLSDIFPNLFSSKFDWGAYNNLLKNSSFWDSVPADRMLLCQSDAMLIQPMRDYYWNFDYIGAPWAIDRCESLNFYKYSSLDGESCEEFWVTRAFCQSSKFNYSIMGNGGLSIRKSSVMSEICSVEPILPGEPEDLFFSRHLRNYSANVPSLADAKSFSCETSCSESVAFHASYLYLTAAEQASIYEKHLKHLLGLTDYLVGSTR